MARGVARALAVTCLVRTRAPPCWRHKQSRWTHPLLGVSTHRVNDIKLSSGEVKGHVGGSLVHGSGRDGREILGTDSEGGVGGCEARVEVDRGLLNTGFASQRPVVTVHGVINHNSSKGLLVESIDKSLLFGFGGSGGGIVLIGGNKSGHSKDGSNISN